MKSHSSIALKELFNDSAKIIEEFQAQCILMASEFDELSKGNIISDFDYPTFTNEIKRICYTSKTVKKEVTNINNILFNENENNNSNSYIDSLLIEMAKRTRKPLGQSFMKKVRHTFPETPYRNIKARIIQLISEGKIIDYTEQDEANRDPTKSKRGHPRTKMYANQPPPNLSQEQLHLIENMLPVQQMQQIQQLQQLQQMQLQLAQQQKQQQHPQQLQQQQHTQQQQQQQQLQNIQNPNQNTIKTKDITKNLDNDNKSDVSDDNHFEDGAMAAAVNIDIPYEQNRALSRFETTSEVSEEDSIDFETAFDQAVGLISDTRDDQKSSNNISNTPELAKEESTPSNTG